MNWLFLIPPGWGTDWGSCAAEPGSLGSPCRTSVGTGECIWWSPASSHHSAHRGRGGWEVSPTWWRLRNRPGILLMPCHPPSFFIPVLLTHLGRLGLFTSDQLLLLQTETVLTWSYDTWSRSSMTLWAPMFFSSLCCFFHTPELHILLSLSRICRRGRQEGGGRARGKKHTFMKRQIQHLIPSTPYNTGQPEEGEGLRVEALLLPRQTTWSRWVNIWLDLI